MKVLLLIIAIYALIFNQASKQGDVKASLEVKQIKKELQSADNIYFHRSDFLPEKSPFHHISEKAIQKAAGNYIFQPAVMQAELKYQPTSDQIYYPNTANLYNKKS
jgi:hypothetical protein